MVNINISQTIPVNPADSSPHLTVSELWQVLRLKCRQPELFVAPIERSRVIEDTPTNIKREVWMKKDIPTPPGQEPSQSQIENIPLVAPWKADFYNETTGAFVNNTISQGRDETDSYLSFFFEWPFPNMEEGSEEAEKTRARLWEAAKGTVQHTIDVARQMKKDGKIANN